MAHCMCIDLISLFPEMIGGFMHASILARAQKQQQIQYCGHQLRHWANNKHLKVYGRPFGSGWRMLLQCEPAVSALNELRTAESLVVYTSPDGELLTTTAVRLLSKRVHIIFISGYYEWLDQRVRDRYVDQELLIGDDILINGTLAAAVIIDATFQVF